MLTVPSKVSPYARVSERNQKTPYTYKDLEINCPQVSPNFLFCQFPMFSLSREALGTLQKFWFDRSLCYAAHWLRWTAHRLISTNRSQSACFDNHASVLVSSKWPTSQSAVRSKMPWAERLPTLTRDAGRQPLHCIGYVTTKALNHSVCPGAVKCSMLTHTGSHSMA